MKIKERLTNAWNAFNSSKSFRPDVTAYSSIFRPDRARMGYQTEKTIIGPIYNRISMDISSAKIMHVVLDDNERYLRTVNSDLNNCLTLEANKDQTSNQFLQDVCISLFDEGVVAIVPVDTDISILDNSRFKVKTLRTGKILEWFPDHVRVNVYNDRRGQREDLILPKSAVAIIENPLYAVMNEPNGTLKRLMRKLALIDVVDEQVSSGKLDVIIQLPYVIKTQSRRDEAEKRRKEIEMQLTNSKYGIAYTDGTEKIVQLNRPVENNLMTQIEFLTTLLYSQLGISKEVLEGTASEEQMLNYYVRTLEPILTAITKEMKRKFLSKTARTQKQSIEFFRDSFKLVPVTKLAEIVDSFTRNEIMSSNEIRSIMGLKPSEQPRADELVNKNITPPSYETTNQNEGESETDAVDAQLQELMKELGIE